MTLTWGKSSMKFRLKKEEIIKNLIWLVVLALGIVLYYWRLYGQIRLGDSLFLSGLLFLCVGLYRVVRWLGFFDSTIYGFNRLLGRTKQDLTGFTQDHPYTQSFGELLILSIVFICLSLMF